MLKSLSVTFLCLVSAAPTFAWELPEWTGDLARSVNLEAAAPALDFARSKGAELGGAAASLATPAIDAAAQLPSSARQAWGTATEYFPDTIGMPVPTAPDFAMWLHLQQIQAILGSMAFGERYDAAQIAVAAQFAQLPRDPNWWRDVSVSTAVIGASTLGATAVCTVAAAPVGPVAMAAAGTGCGWAGSEGGSYMVHESYARLGVVPNQDAIILGRGLGASLGTRGAYRLMQSSWQNLSSASIQRASKLVLSGGLAEKGAHLWDFVSLQADPAE